MEKYAISIIGTIIWFKAYTRKINRHTKKIYQHIEAEVLTNTWHEINIILLFNISHSKSLFPLTKLTIPIQVPPSQKSVHIHIDGGTDFKAGMMDMICLDAFGRNPNSTYDR